MTKKNILVRSKKKKAFAFLKEKKLHEAKVLLLQLIKADRMDPENWMALGALHGWQGNHAESEKCCRKAVELRPDNAESQYNLGVALREQGKATEAIEQFNKAIVLDTDYEQAYDSLANVLVNDIQYGEAIDVFRKITQRWPEKIEGYGNLGTILQMCGKSSEAITICRQAIERNPKFYTAYDVIGNAHVSRGDFEEGIRWQKEALKIQPNDSRQRSNFLLNLNYLPHSDRGDVFQSHCEWNKHHSASMVPEKYDNDRNVERVLRIGYVSPDLREHSVAYFIEPILAASRNSNLESFCYSDMPKPDKVTLRLEALSDHWCYSHALTDQQLFDQIQKDEIDVLIDLSGHTANSRLKLFSMRPAPVQIAYLGYPNTTGVAGIQYRITDALADPEGEEQYYTEELLRLPGCFLCYQPEAAAPEVSTLPEGEVVFGSFNNLAKINDDVVALWAQTVLSVEGSRLLMKNPSLSDQAVRERYLERFFAHGIDRGRVELIGHTPSRQEHLGLYSRMHIALDTFPYNGTTTTCEALWMGVPVITLAGQYHAGRVGVSLLNAVSCSQWVGNSREEFIGIARELAGDMRHLADLRASMRKHITASRLCDANAFVANLALAYRKVWRRWCEEGGRLNQ